MARLLEFMGDTGNDEFDPKSKLDQMGRLALTVMGVLVFGFGIAAAFVPIGGAVVGIGQIGAETQVKKIAHPSGGVVAQIYVKDGDVVKAGQPLLRLDTTVSGVDASLSGRSVNQLLAERARLLAERDGKDVIIFPPELTRNDTPDAREAMLSEQRQLLLHGQERSDQRQLLVARIAQLREQIRGYHAQLASLRRQRELIAPELKGVQDLWEKRLVTINRLNQVERGAADIDGSIGALQATIAQTKAQILEVSQRIIALDSSARSEAGNQLVQVNRALNEQTVRNVSADNQYERSIIRAPYQGVIDKLAIASVGGVIQPAQVVMEIVPTRDTLIVEALISPNDIDRLRVTQDARVRLSAFNQQATPEIGGKVTYVSANRFDNPNTGASAYRVRIELDAKQVKDEGLELKAGMPAEVFISTGNRSLLSYVTKPIRDQLARALRD